ncbi:MAG: putative Ig domain-containing protein [Planctomycetes bacterium]|nr:putative Ig domain-containing protein [Planctomycetota bacterium]
MGDLPPGITLTTATDDSGEGVLSGVTSSPPADSPYTFTVQVTDDIEPDRFATQQYTIMVEPAAGP